MRQPTLPAMPAVSVRGWDSTTLLDPIIEMLKLGRENLDIIQWALINHHASMREVREILRQLDVNSARIECSFDPLRGRATG